MKLGKNILHLPEALLFKLFGVDKHLFDGRSSQIPLNKAISPSLSLELLWHSATKFRHTSLHGNVDVDVGHLGSWTEQVIKLDSEEQFLNLLRILEIKPESSFCDVLGLNLVTL